MGVEQVKIRNLNYQKDSVLHTISPLQMKFCKGLTDVARTEENLEAARNRSGNKLRRTTLRVVFQICESQK